MNETENNRKFFAKKRNLAALIILLLLTAALVGGVVLSCLLYQNGELGEEAFSHRILFVFICLVCMSLVFVFELVFRVRLPLFFEIMIMGFAFMSTALSTTYGFYALIPEWDSIVHTVSGMVFSAMGLCLAHLIFRDRLEGKHQALVFILFAFLIALAVGYLWEIFEYTADAVIENNLQCYRNGIVKDLGNGTYIVNSLRGTGLIDTLTDMIVNCAGAVGFLLVFLILFLKKPNTLSLFRAQPFKKKSNRPQNN